MDKIYHDPNNPQCDAVERYAVGGELQHACDNICGEACRCKDNKRRYDIFILRSQLFYDIEAELNIITRSRRTDSLLQDNGLDNTEQISPLLHRWIKKYVSLAKRKLAAVLVAENNTADTNYIHNNEEISFPLAIGSWWNDNALQALTDAIHDLLVNGALYEYLLLYLTAKDPVTMSKEQQVQLALEEIHNALCSYKTGHLRKGMHPFP